MLYKLSVLAVLLGSVSVLADISENDLVGAEIIDVTFNDVQSQAINDSSETKEFQTEVNRLMEIIVNSLYKTRDIFLRELVSNAVDALDKIRFNSLQDRSELDSKKTLDVRIQADKDAGTLTIIDSGIGMTRKELAENLGTVAHSGTATFLDAFSQAQESGENPLTMIGQFGVGFYSAFLIADEVIVISKSNNDDKQYVWRSKADGKYSISEDPRGVTLGRGTAIVLKVKEDAKDFLEADTIEQTVQRYSGYTHHPIYLYSSETETVEDEDDESSEDASDDDELSTSDEDDEEKEPKTVTKYFWKRLNAIEPIWIRPKSQVELEEYEKFYNGFTKGAGSSSNMLAYTHFRAEGELEFDSILFIPDSASYGFYDNYYNAKSKLKLFVRRVLVADEFEDIVPRYLNFVKGLVDSNDLPLNVNREDLQKNKIMTLISRKLTRKVLDLLRDLARKEEEPEEDEDEEEESEQSDDEDGESSRKKEKKSTEKKYTKFWNEFGKSIKLGILEDQRNQKRLVELLRFPSSTEPEGLVSLANYVKRMKPGQKQIYFLSAGSLDEAQGSPFLERFKSKGIEVLFFIDNLDEYLQLQDYDDITIQSITKENVELDGKRMIEFLKEKEEEFKDLRTWLKDNFKSKISKVQISPTLDKTPMAVATTSYGTSTRMEKIGKSQAFGASSSMKATKVLQLNYRHPVIIELKNKIEDGDEDDESVKDLACLLIDSAMVQSGFDIEAEDQADFGARIARVVSSGLGVPADAELLPEPDFAGDFDTDDDTDDDDEEDDEEDYEDFEEIDDDEKEEL